MFEKQFQYRTDERQYELVLHRDHGWSSSRKRMLIVLEAVPTISLKDKVLLTGYVRQTIVNCINYAKSQARAISGSSVDYSFAVINFNNRKHMNLGRAGKAEAESEFTRRSRALIKKLDPTHVFVSGDTAASHLIPNIQNAPYKRGWVHLEGGRRYSHTFDLDRALAKNFINADLLGYWSRHLTYLMLGAHPYDLSHLKSNPRYCGTIKRFQALMDQLEQLGPEDFVAYDTETANLSAKNNTIYTMQFCLSTNPDVGYVLPFRHPKTPFNSRELAYIERRIRKWFSRQDAPTLITQNGAFDAMVTRAQFNLPVLHHGIWETMAGEHLLDENISGLNKVGPPMGGLAAIFASYGNDFYYQATFSKDERASVGLVDPDDPEFLKYGAMDVQSIMAIRGQALRRASHERIAGKPYRPWFEAHMRNIMGPTVHAISHLQTDGSYVNKQYLRHLLTPESRLSESIKDAEEQLRVSDAAKEANSALLQDSGLRAGSLFGGTTEQWVLRLSRGAHKAKLFFDVLGLEPVSFTKTGQPAVDASFIATYAHRYPEVAILGEWSARQKLQSTYVKGWLRRLTRGLDSRKDSYLRASYSFFQVVTGRLGSSNPNLQNIPSRGALSSIIKEMFLTTPGKLLIRFDYSAHEVRMWAIAAGDKVLAASFIAGLELRQKLIRATSQKIIDDIRKELQQKGDVHIQNVYRFFRKWVTKDDPLREAIKAVVFGVLYGKSPKSLGNDVGLYSLARKELRSLEIRAAKADKKELRDIKLRTREVQKFLSGATPKQQEQEDTRYAQSIIDKMFGEFEAGAAWTRRMSDSAAKNYYVWSPIGRKRRTFAALTGVPSVVAGSVRQGSNAPIQGVASELAVRGARDLQVNYYKELPRLARALTGAQTEEELLDLWIEFNRIVHDATYYGVPYAMVIPFIHMLQWYATFDLANSIEKEFGLKFTTPPEIEIEVGARDDKTYKWDWTMPNLMTIIDKAVKDAEELGVLEGEARAVMTTILKPYKSRKIRAYLQKRWPLLNVRDLDSQIVRAVKEYEKAA